MTENKHEAQRQGIDRRVVVKGAFWSVPVVATAVAVPLAAASEAPLPPGITITPGEGPWTDRILYRGYIAEGIVISLADDDGLPLAGVSVALSTNADRNNFWFVSDPALSASNARRRANQKTSIVLVTDANGQIALNWADPALGQVGYLRKGSDGERGGATLTATADGATQSITIVNSSLAGGSNPGIQPLS